MSNKISILYPKESDGAEPAYRRLSDDCIHDLGIDSIVSKLSHIESERAYIMQVMSRMSDSARVAVFRADVFEDILNSPELRESMMKILDRINFIKSYGTFKRDHDETASAFELMHRLEEINDYIISVEAIHNVLSDAAIKSEGLTALKKYVDDIFADNAFAELKSDISALKASTDDLRSVTLGVNLNDRFEAESIGLISVNNKKFTKSNVIGNFSDAITARRGGIHNGNEWDDNYKYQPFNASASDISASLEGLGRMKVASTGPLGLLTMASIPEGDATTDVTRYMDRIINHMLHLTVRRLREVLSRYVNITITTITDLIPEFMYYIRWAEYIERLSAAGCKFHKAKAYQASPDGLRMNAVGVYNLKLAQTHMSDKTDIVRNDLIFDNERCLYILTGANRGGKTTITQAIGQLFCLAQGGIYIPGSAFEYEPVDCIYTHFPADEDKTMDLGRLGEECKRFRELYGTATDRSLILLNETFSTTSFEEGYYIARDAVRALLTKGVRTIYNTHMHKLARDIGEINEDTPSESSAKSLIVISDGGERSFKIAVAPPEGMSYAEDIARKYGVTYECLTS